MHIINPNQTDLNVKFAIYTDQIHLQEKQIMLNLMLTPFQYIIRMILDVKLDNFS